MKKNERHGERFNPYKTFHGLFIPEAIAELPTQQLSQGAKIAYGRLCRYAGKDGNAYPKISTLAQQIGCVERQASKYLSELKEFGLIETRRVGLGKPNEYFFLWHEIFDGRTRDSATDRNSCSHTVVNNDSVPSYKESHEKESQKKRSILTANAVLTTDDSINAIVKHYRHLIDSRAKLDPRARNAIEEQLKHWSLNELLEAISNFHDNAQWHMRYHRYNGLSWFFRDETQVDKWFGMTELEEYTEV